MELLSKVGRYEFLSEPFIVTILVTCLWGIWAIIC